MKNQRDSLPYLWPLTVLGLLLLGWQFLLPTLVASYLIPTPAAIFETAYRSRSMLLHNALVTFFEAFSGFAVANLTAFLLAVLSAYFRTAEQIIFPYAIALKTAPILALAPLLVIWFGTGMLSKVVAAALICFFPMLINCIRGLRRIDPDAVDLFRSLGAPETHIFLNLRLPYALPYIFSALKISSSLSIVGAIVGEFVGAQEGLGYVITVSSYHFEIALMFAAVFAASMAGIALFTIVSVLEAVLVPWGEAMNEPG